MKIPLKKVFENMVNQILFGETEEEHIPTLDGEFFSDMVEKFYRNSMNILRHPITGLTKSLSHNLRILKESRENAVLKEKLYKLSQICCDDRAASIAKQGAKNNLMDILANHNIKAEEEGRVDDIFDKFDIFENLVAFYLAGTDTSRSSSGTMIHLLSRNKSIQTKLRNSFKDLKVGGEDVPEGIFDYDSSSYMNAFFDESMRRYGPASFIFTRICVVPCTIGGVKIKRGTEVMVTHGGFQCSKHVFDRPLDFNPDRFEHNQEVDSSVEPVKIVTSAELKMKARKSEYMPFGYGRRACIGKSFAQIVVKIGLKSLLDRFELDCEGLEEGRWIQISLLERETAQVKLRPLRC